MHKQELINEITKTKEHLANMEKMLAECDGQRWKPENGDDFYCIDSVGDVWREKFFSTTGYDMTRYNVYNCFQTREQAEAEAEKILVRRMLEDIARRLNKGEDINYEDNTQSKFCLVYNIIKDRIEIESNCNRVHIGVVYCSSIKFYDVAIQEIGEERLKRYLRGE